MSAIRATRRGREGVPTIEELILGKPLEDKISEEEVQEIVKGNLQEKVLSPEEAVGILGASPVQSPPPPPSPDIVYSVVKPFESIEVTLTLRPRPEDFVEEVGFEAPAPCEAPAPKVPFDLVTSVPARSGRVVLIDGSNLAMRCFFPLRDMCRRDGKPTGLLYGILKAVRNLQKECNALPVFVWDGGGSAKKRLLYPEYKGNREYSEVHDNCFSQLKDVKEYLRCTGIPQAWVPGEEADDVIASLACRNFRDQFVFVYSNDDDFMQLVDDQHIIVVKPTKEGPEFFDSEKVEERMGVPPEQVPEYRALRGDKSDNLPGAFRVAGKVLVAQIKSHGSLEKMYESEESLGKLTTKQRETLWSHREQAFLNRRLMLLDRGIECSLEVSTFDDGAMKVLFEEMEFNSYLSEFEHWVESFSDTRGFLKVGRL